MFAVSMGTNVRHRQEAITAIVKVAWAPPILSLLLRRILVTKKETNKDVPTERNAETSLSIPPSRRAVLSNDYVPLTK